VGTSIIDFPKIASPDISHPVRYIRLAMTSGNDNILKISAICGNNSRQKIPNPNFPFLPLNQNHFKVINLKLRHFLNYNLIIAPFSKICTHKQFVVSKGAKIRTVSTEVPAELN